MKNDSSGPEELRRTYKPFAVTAADQPKTKRSGWRDHLRWMPALLGWLIIWQAAYWLVDQDILLASPAQVMVSLAGMITTKAFWLAAIFSMLRIQAGYGLGLFIGTVLAILTVRLHWLHRFVHPIIGAVRATPVASFIILALVWMSSGRVVIFIVFLMVLPVVWANVAEGIRQTDPKLLEMAFVFHFNRKQLIRFVYVPSIAPFFMTAATTSLGLGWKAGVATEVLGRPPLSLGSSLYEAKIYLASAELLAYTCVVIIISLALERLLVWLFQRAHQFFRQSSRQAAGLASVEPTDQLEAADRTEDTP